MAIQQIGTLIRKLAALGILAVMLYLAVDQAGAVSQEDSADPQSYPTPTTDIYNPYPGATITSSYPEPTTSASPRASVSPGTQAPTATLNPSQSPFNFPTPVLTTTVIYTGTPTVLPQPTFDLLFPNILPKTPTTTASASPEAVSGEPETRSSIPPGVYALGAIVVILWGLLGAFLVVYLKRLGY